MAPEIICRSGMLSVLLFAAFGGAAVAENDGDPAWAIGIGVDGEDAVLDVAFDKNGNALVAGVFSGTVDFDPGEGAYLLSANAVFGAYDAFLAKYDSNGSFIWALSFGAEEFEIIRALAVSENGDVYVTGSFEGSVDFDPGPGEHVLTGHSDPTGYIAKFDSDGDFLWAFAVPSTSELHCYDVAVDQLGNVILGGRFYGTADFDTGPGTHEHTSLGNNDGFIISVDESGNFLWAAQFGSDEDISVSSVAMGPTGEVHATGTFVGSADFDPGVGAFPMQAIGNSDAFVVKLTANGTFTWAAALGADSAGVGNGIAVDQNGGIAVTGSFGHIADFDPGPGEFNLSADGPDDIFIAKLHGDGTFAWARRIGGESFDEGHACAVDSAGNVYTVSSFRETIDADPGPGELLITTGSFEAALFHKLSPSGEFLWARAAPGIGPVLGLTVAVDNAMNVLGGGFFYVDALFSADGVGLSLEAQGGYDGFAVKFNSLGVPGDVDGSGTVNAVDVQLVINEALGVDTGFVADVNGDNAVNAVDVQLVINAALGI